MTAETVQISIIVKAGEKTAEIIKEIDVQDLEKETASLGIELNGQIFGLTLELLDEHLISCNPPTTLIEVTYSEGIGLFVLFIYLKMPFSVLSRRN